MLRLLQPPTPTQLRCDDEPDRLREHDPRPGSRITEPATIGGNHTGTTTARYKDLGIPSASLVDGPAGIRIQQSFTEGGTTYYQYATAWPIGTMLAQTWDADLVESVGQAVATEMTEFEAAIWLAPGMNLHRDPLNGRNFEYFSEDPLVTGLSATWITQGVQSRAGVGVTIKHLAANEQELQRQRSNSVIGERALRELYLKGFEIAVKSTQPMAGMTSYNLINGTAARAITTWPPMCCAASGVMRAP